MILGKSLLYVLEGPSPEVPDHKSLGHLCNSHKLDFPLVLAWLCSSVPARSMRCFERYVCGLSEGYVRIYRGMQKKTETAIQGHI